MALTPAPPPSAPSAAPAIRAPARGGVLQHAAALLVFALLTLAATYPMAFRLTVMDAGDSAFFAWELGWELHALASTPSQLPHGNIFHPLRYTLGMDEPILGTTMLVAPLWLFTQDAVWLLNVARLLTFVLSGYSGWLLGRFLGLSPLAAFLAGAAFMLSPIRTDQIAHVSTLGTQWLPLVLLFAFRYARDGRRRDALLGAGFFVLESLACGYHGLIGLAVLPPAILVAIGRRWERLPGALLGAAVAGLGLLPLYALHQAALRPLGYLRAEGETVLYSAPLESFLATSSWNLLYGTLTTPFRTVDSNKLFPGLVLPGLVLLGAWQLWRRRQRPQGTSVALLVMLVLAALLALGPEVRLFDQVIAPGPFALARELPLFRMIRVPARAGIFVALGLALLAARALDRWRPHPALAAVVVAAALLETVIAPIPMPAWAQVVDTRRAPPAVYQWLAQQPGDFAVVELPILDIGGLLDHSAHHESIYMVHSTRGHWKRLLNGYAGIEPAQYVELRNACHHFPSSLCLEAIRTREARYVILHPGGYGPNKRARLQRELPQFQPPLAEVARFGDDVVFELRAARE